MSVVSQTGSAEPGVSAGASAGVSAGGRRREVMVVLPPLLLAVALAMLDNLIVGTAMPRIVGELGGLAHLSWVVTAYILGTTVSTPIWGKIGDLYGRKNIFLTSIVIFLLGSALSGAAQSMGQLIGFRALQGLGAGGLLVGAMAIIGDLVPPRERGRYQGMMAAVMAVTTVAGPLAGGFITDHLSWRWAFYVNVPLGAVALVWLIARLHLPRYRTEHRIDWLGAGLLAVGITALVLITTWGGSTYAWLSWPIIGLVMLAVASLVAFAVVERRVAEPVLSLNLFRNRNFALVSGIGFLLGFGMFGAVNFLPIYQQTVQGASATNSGLLLLPMMAAMLVVSIVAGQVITRTGRYKLFPILGGVGMVLGMILLSFVDVNTTKTELALYMVVFGLGMGCLMQTTMLIAQNSVEQKDLGVASSTATLFRSIGGSFGVALFGTIFARHFTSDLTATLGPQAAEQFAHGGGQIDPRVVAVLPESIRFAVLDGIASSLATVFVWAIPFAALVAILAVFIREVALRGHDDPPAVEAA
jgi:EmrB/QacA subfamily drug resistance transporter